MSGPARTVLIAHPGAELYGADRMVLESVHALRSWGDRVVVTVPSTGPLVAELESLGAVVDICRTPVLRRSTLRPLGLLRLLVETARAVPGGIRILRRTGADAVYVNTLTIPLWFVLARVLRRPVLCHVHEAERAVPRRLRRLLTAPLLLANRVVANSQVTLEVLAQTFPSLRGRCSVVPNAVPGPPGVTPARGEPGPPVRLVYVGRLSPRKGVDVAVRAVSTLVDEGHDVRLDVVGSIFPGYEWFADELAAQISASGLTERVTLAGFEPDVWPRLAAADIVIVPSVGDESFGNTAVEAVLAGRPAVVSAVGGLLEASAGYRCVLDVEPGDPEALAGAVAQIVAGWDKFCDWAETDRILAEQRHSRPAYRDRLGAVLDDLLERR
jgi:glycosyltransferase involved in cell wall biosynthesis